VGSRLASGLHGTMRAQRQLAGKLAAALAPPPLALGLVNPALRSSAASSSVRALSSASAEGIGAPFLHSFAKASPGAPPAAVHVRQDGACYVIDQVRQHPPRARAVQA
jgi:hypothetical protein